MNAEWYFSLAGYQSNIQIAHYEVDGHYDWHIDTFMPDEKGFQRKISIVLMLSDETSYEGGNLILSPKLSESESEQVKTFKGKGSIIAFPSCLWHKVTPVISGERFTAVAWFSGPAYR
jgi:PKHD-type hydroxylase